MARACRRWGAACGGDPWARGAVGFFMFAVLRRGERTANMKNTPILPHHKLHVYGIAREMLVAVRDARIRDTKLRDEALRAAKGTCLNCAEGAGRVTRADKARAFTVARGEAVEAAAAIEIAALLGDARVEDAERVAILADRVVAMLTRLIR